MWGIRADGYDSTKEGVVPRAKEREMNAARAVSRDGMLLVGQLCGEDQRMSSRKFAELG